MEGTGGQKDNQSQEGNSKRPNVLGRVDLKKNPYKVDVEAFAAEYFPGSKHLKTATGEEYIIDGATRKTILLFENPTDNGFTSIFSPLSPQEITKGFVTMPEDQKIELARIFSFSDTDPTKAKDITGGMSNASGQGAGSLLENSLLNTFSTHKMSEATPIQPETATLMQDLPPPDLPENHFINLTPEEYKNRKKQQWESVKDLDDNNPRKILYYRRFTSDFLVTHPLPWIAAMGSDIAQELRDNSSQYAYYPVDNSKFAELQALEPYTCKIDLPQGKKLGFVIGYHHLEKPWGNLFMEMFRQQVQFSPDQIEFIQIQNNNIPTGAQSRISEEEIQNIAKAKGVSHIIDIHEHLSFGNHYDPEGPAENFKGTFARDKKLPDGGEHTLDPTVPLWAIEQYYEGHIYPQLQYAVNDQIKKAEILIKSLMQ